MNDNKVKDYLDDFLDGNNEEVKKQVNIVKSTNYKNTENSLEYINVDMSSLPMSKFYKPGTQIKIRAAKVSEIQAFSAIDDNNYLDAVDKMNEVLLRCTKYITSDGNIGSYKSIKDGDRMFLLFTIRELTFQVGNNLSKDVQCDNCKHNFKINFRATSNAHLSSTFEFYKQDEFLENFFNPELGCYELIDDNDISWRLSPPSIGIQESFFKYMKSQTANQTALDLTFIKIQPFLLWDKDFISDDNIKQKEKDFTQLDRDVFFALDQLIGLMTFGIEGLITKCPECGEEVRTKMTFPNGTRAILGIPNILERFVKK